MNRILLLFGWIIVTLNGYCQFNTPSIPVSPTTASLLQYSQIPVSKYTGLPEIQFPLYTIKTGTLALPISLSYHAGGIKVQQEASWVGLGWALDAGGVISRSIRDRDDVDGPGVGYFGSPALPALYDGEWFAAAVVSSDPQANLMKSFLRGQYDSEPDMFYYNFCGNSGKFVFEKQTATGNVLIGTDLNQKNNLRIECLYDEKNFVVTDGNGTKYYFGTREYSYNEVKYATNNHGSLIEDMSLSNDCIDKKHITSWYLDKIKSVNGEDSIIFSYTTPDPMECDGITSSTSLMETIYERKTYSGSPYADNVPVFLKDSYLSRSLTQAADLTSIIFKNGRLDFNCSSREDLIGIGSPKLDNIIVYDNNNIEKKKINFEYDYFNGPNPSLGRLKLEKLFIAESPYEFTYNESVLLPDKRSKSIDYWGYFNDYSNLSLVPKSEFGDEFSVIYDEGGNRNANPNTLQAGTLTGIKYPTGGSTKFDYEGNDVQGKTPIWAYESQSAESNFAYYQVPNNLYVQKTFYVKDETWMTVSAYGICQNPCNGMPGLPEADEAFALLVKLPDSTSFMDYDNLDQYFYEDIESQFLYGECENDMLQPYESKTIKVLPGWYRIVTQTRIYQSYTQIGVSYGKIIGYKNYIEAGGLRVKRITSTDEKGASTVNRYIYRNSSDTSKSSGLLISFPQNKFLTDVVYPDGLTERLEIMQSTSLDPLSTSAQGRYVGYDEVTELFGENGENGKKITVYSNGNYQSIPYVPPPDINFNGDLLKETSYKANGDLLSKVENYYTEYGPASKEIPGMTHTTYSVLYNFSEPPPQCVYDPNIAFLLTDQDLAACYLINYYPVTVNWRRIAYSATTLYTLSGNTYDTTFYTYNTLNKQIATKSQTSSGNSKIITKFKYPPDYSSSAGTIYSSMVAAHLINPPVELAIWREKDGVQKLVSSDVTEFKSFASNKFISPYKSNTLKTLSPIPSSVVGETPGSSGPYNSLFFDNAWFDQKAEYDYDDGGRVKQISSFNGIVKSYIWGYLNAYPIAEVINVAQSSVLSILDQSILQNPASAGALRTELNKIRQNFPSAQITTFTYEPLIGMTSKTDVNNKTTYYEYDGFGRLNLIRDQDNNIIKKFSYNYYAGHPEQSNLYVSDAISDYYYSQNCSPEEAPVAYHVSVPQGMFTSSVDQLTANQQAQQYAQNQANQYGTCEILNVSIYGEDNSGTDITIQLHNVTSGQDYWFTAYAHNSGTLGDVPPGTYNITLTPNNPSGWYNYSVGCGYYNDGPDAIAFYGVDLNSSCNSIMID